MRVDYSEIDASVNPLLDPETLKLLDNPTARSHVSGTSADRQAFDDLLPWVVRWHSTLRKVSIPLSADRSTSTEDPV